MKPQHRISTVTARPWPRSPNISRMTHPHPFSGLPLFSAIFPDAVLVEWCACWLPGADMQRYAFVRKLGTQSNRPQTCRMLMGAREGGSRFGCLCAAVLASLAHAPAASGSQVVTHLGRPIVCWRVPAPTQGWLARRWRPRGCVVGASSSRPHGWRLGTTRRRAGHGSRDPCRPLPLGERRRCRGRSVQARA